MSSVYLDAPRALHVYTFITGILLVSVEKFFALVLPLAPEACPAAADIFCTLTSA